MESMIGSTLALRHLHNAMDKFNNWVRLHIFQITAVIFWIGIIALIYNFMRTNDLTFVQFFQLLEHFMVEHWYGVLIFVAVVVVLRPFTLIPAMVFVTVAGYVFGLWIGFVVGHIAMTASAIMPYYFGRLFPVDLDNGARYGRFSMLGMAHRLARMLRRNAFEALVMLRIIAPYDVVSFASGNVDIRMSVFLGGTFIGNLAVSYWAAALGAALEDITEAGSATGSLDLLISSGVVFVLSLLLSRYLRKRVID